MEKTAFDTASEELLRAALAFAEHRPAFEYGEHLVVHCLPGGTRAGARLIRAAREFSTAHPDAEMEVINERRRTA